VTKQFATVDIYESQVKEEQAIAQGVRMVKSPKEKAQLFRSLHHGDHILVLPNAWDVPSARVFENAGFPAIATSSAALAVSLGQPDGEKLEKQELFSAIRRIVNAVALPVSADIESGFGASLAQLTETIRGVIKAGAVGVNIEDIADFEAKSLVPLEKQVDRIKVVRNASESLGIPLVVNARTDAFRFGLGDEKAKLEQAISRSIAYADAGADCLYPMGLTDKETISTFVSALGKPVNVMARRGAPTIPELERIGVARLSLGPGPMYATMGLLQRIARELKEKRTYELMLEGAIGFDELNALARPRA
jgi:2-methylisocitrate lyase-like PEP mutase family enzyme